MELVQGKESAGKSDAGSDRKRCQKISGKLYDRESRRRAAYWSEREGTHTSPFPPDLMRVTHAHPLNPAALAFVPFGIVKVRVRVSRASH